MWPPEPFGTWVIDLDGVIWLTGQPIDGVAEAVTSLREAGVRVLFATNNSAPTREQLHARMANCGITTSDDDLLSSADVAAHMLSPGSSALVLADDGVREALSRRGVTVVEAGPADAVVVGWTKGFTFDAIGLAAGTVRAGARLIGTNEDPTHPTPDGLLPGAGALLAAVATAAETTPEVAGKPHRPTADAILARATDLRVMVGDRPSTDGVLAEQLEIPFALVLSGVTGPDGIPSDPAPDHVSVDLATLVRTVLGQPVN
ncbi:MAG TPA: HAD-IIA family hydrolase [Acidimicrobiales bacterium]|jgi:HAD superfamily hydrolase (TIGR01450 family)|nr:HAD-IIA family hydrolase [Acidimicrobiales bacterium]